MLHGCDKEQTVGVRCINGLPIDSGSGTCLEPTTVEQYLRVTNSKQSSHTPGRMEPCLSSMQMLIWNQQTRYAQSNGRRTKLLFSKCGLRMLAAPYHWAELSGHVFC